MAASCIAPPSVKYVFTSHSSGARTGPSPPMRLTSISWSLTAFRITNQWPGGVSESGPSAQNSASTRV